MDVEVRPRRKRERAAYRHGDVRVAAITAGVALLSSKPEVNLSLREVARQVGVAHHALYHYFSDKRALECALAAQGFRMLGEEVASVVGPADFVAAYVAFALRNRPLYDVMMSQPYAMFESDVELRAQARRVIAFAVAAFAAGSADSEAARRTVLRAWMLTHGALALRSTGALRTRDDAGFIAELLRIAGLAPDKPEGPQSLWDDVPGEL